MTSSVSKGSFFARSTAFASIACNLDMLSWQGSGAGDGSAVVSVPSSSHASATRRLIMAGFKYTDNSTPCLLGRTGVHRLRRNLNSSSPLWNNGLLLWSSVLVTHLAAGRAASSKLESTGS